MSRRIRKNAPRDCWVGLPRCRRTCSPPPLAGLVEPHDRRRVVDQVLWGLYAYLMRILAIGTCRIYGAAAFLQGARRFPHRVHNPAEIERAIDLLDGRDYPSDLSHVLSEYALSIVQTYPEGFRERLEDPLVELRRQTFDAYVVEVSSLRTYLAASENGPVLVDSIVARALPEQEDQLTPFYDAGRLRRLHNISSSPDDPAETKAAMRRIKQRLGGPIVWVSHCGLADPREGEDQLALTRRLLAEKVSNFAALMGDGFVDPALLAAQHGRETFFGQNGADLYHYTDTGHAALADAVAESLGRTPA